jgi:hypothetical protein
MFRYSFETTLSSISSITNFSELLQWLQDCFTMVNLRTLTSLTCITQLAVAAGNVYTNNTQLRDIVPKRDVLYVGGQYTNITV